MNDRPISIALFGAFIALSLTITWWAARQTHSRREFYAAGSALGGFQNGLAIAGDYTSAATFLGVTGLVYSSGFDGLLYAVGFLMAWPIILFLIAEPLRNLGRYTFADVTSYRLSAVPMRSFAAISTLVMSLIWKNTTSRGAVLGGMVGLATSVCLVVLGPGVWTSVLGLGRAPFPLENPAIVSCPAALLTIWMVSSFDHSRTAQLERAAFQGQFVRGELGAQISVEATEA